MLRILLLVLTIAACTVVRAQERPVALGGTIVTPDGTMDGWILIQNGTIRGISQNKPDTQNATYIETRGVIYPGLVDIHNHPMYSAFPRWSPFRQFVDRYEWRRFEGYRWRVGLLASELLRIEKWFCDLLRFAELRALIGGTTSIQGISPIFSKERTEPYVPDCIKGLIRHLDWYSGLWGNEIGKERLHGVIDPLGANARMGEVKDKLNRGVIDRVIVHLSEGVDKTSGDEFRLLMELGLPADKVVIIHGTALRSQQLRQMAENRTALVWSPRSNHVLYGTTTDVKAAKEARVTMALAPDWGITGGANLLAELVYTWNLNVPPVREIFSEQELFEMSTQIPARIANLQDKIGSLKVGFVADLFVLRGDASDPYHALVRARPEDVQLVMIGGRAYFGTEGLVVSLAKASREAVSINYVDVCGSTRALALPRSSADQGMIERLITRLKNRFRELGIGLAPLVECP